jgi:DNA-binding GntR family transcriptional regulator
VAASRTSLPAAERAYRHLLQRIVDGRLAASAFLVEHDIAAEAGVSRTPVREALQRLATEGLIDWEDRRRAVVRAFDEAEIDECFQLRALWEGYAAGRAASRIDAAALARLKELAATMERVVARKGRGAAASFATLNDRFHDEILAAAGSARLRELMRPLLQVQLVLARRFRAAIELHLQRSCLHHREIIDALEAHDAGWAEAQMRTHLIAARNPG